MKTVKTRHDYIFLIFLPIALVGLVLGIFIPTLLVKSISLISMLLSVFAVIYALTPRGKRIVWGGSPPRYRTWRWLCYLFSWQIALYFIFFSVAQAVMLTVPINSTQGIPGLKLSIIDTLQGLQAGFFGWGFYIVTGMAIGLYTTNTLAPVTLRETVHPVMKKIAEGIFGYGFELFIRQSLAIVIAISLAVNLLQIYQILGPQGGLESLTQLSIHTLLLASCLFLLLSMPLTQQFAQFLWNKKHSPRLMIGIYCLAVLFILFFFNLILKLITAHVITSTPTPINVTALFRSSDKWPIQWSLLRSGWWLAWMPLVAMKFVTLAAGRSIRTFVFANLCLPICISITLLFMQHFSPDFVASLILHITHSSIVTTSVAIISLILLALLFHDPEKAALVKAVSTRPTIQKKQGYIYIQIILQLATLFLVCYLFNSIHFLSLFLIAIVLPIFLIGSLIAISAL